MRKIKALISFVLVLSLVLSMAPNVFAEGGYKLVQIANPDCVFKAIYEDDNMHGFVLLNSYTDADGYYKDERGLFTPQATMAVPMCDDFYGVFKNGLLEFRGSIKDINGSVVIDRNAIYVDGERWIVAENYKYALADKTGNPVTDYKYNGLNCDGLAVGIIFNRGSVKNDYELLDANGNVIVPSGRFEYIIPVQATDKFVAMSNDRYALYSTESNGKRIAYLDGESAESIIGIIFTYLYENNKWVGTNVYTDSGKLLAEKTGGAWHENGFVEYRKDDKIGILAPGGIVTAELGKYKAALTHLAYGNYIPVVNEAGQVGVIDIYGNVKVPFGDYEYIRMINDDLYVVKHPDSMQSLMAISTGQTLLNFSEGTEIYSTCGGSFIAFRLESGDHEFYLVEKDGVIQKPEAEDKNIRFMISVPVGLPYIIVEGNQVPIDVPAQIMEDRTFLPARAIGEALGAEVNWINETRTATAVLDGVEVIIPIGSDTMTVNGVAVPLDAPARIVNDRTLLPVRAISEAFGCSVNWIDHTRTVIITK